MLAENEWFAVRLDIGIPHSKAWVDDYEYTYLLPYDKKGEYSWEIAVCRGDPASEHCSDSDGTQLAVSQRQVFQFDGCPPPR